MVSNVVDVITSSNALLTVITPVPVHFDSILILSNRQVHLQMSVEPGIYLIEETSDLTNWLGLISVTNTSGTFEYIDPVTNLLRRFYRTRSAD